MAVTSSLLIGAFLALIPLVRSDSDDDGGDSDPPQRIVLAHGVLMAALFAIFFPLGAIIMRLSKSSKAAWIHGVWQVISYIGALAGFGIGAYLATEEDYWVTKQGHAIIGTIVVGLLFLQPFFGLLHHRLYTKHGKPTALGLGHRWSGRILLVLGVINGGLGLWLAEEDKNFIIPYSVVAGVLYFTWAGLVLFKKLDTRSRSASPRGDFKEERRAA